MNSGSLYFTINAETSISLKTRQMKLSEQVVARMMRIGQKRIVFLSLTTFPLPSAIHYFRGTFQWPRTRQSWSDRPFKSRRQQTPMNSGRLEVVSNRRSGTDGESVGPYDVCAMGKSQDLGMSGVIELIMRIHRCNLAVDCMNWMSRLAPCQPAQEEGQQRSWWIPSQLPLAGW